MKIITLISKFYLLIAMYAVTTPDALNMHEEVAYTGYKARSLTNDNAKASYTQSY